MDSEFTRRQDDKRLIELERKAALLHGTIFGNGDVGMAERVRHLEAAQEAYEQLRKDDKADTSRAMGTLQEGINRLRSSLDDMRSKLDQQAGGWRVARVMSGVGVPLVTGLLIWIAIQLLTLTGGA